MSDKLKLWIYGIDTSGDTDFWWVHPRNFRDETNDDLVFWFDSKTDAENACRALNLHAPHTQPDAVINAGDETGVEEYDASEFWADLVFDPRKSNADHNIGVIKNAMMLAWNRGYKAGTITAEANVAKAENELETERREMEIVVAELAQAREVIAIYEKALLDIRNIYNMGNYSGRYHSQIKRADAALQSARAFMEGKK